MKKINLVVDKPTNQPWAYHSKAKKLIEHNPNGWVFNIISYRDSREKLESAFKWADLNLFFGFQNARRCERFCENFSRKNTIVNIASHQSFDGGKTTPTNQVKPGKQTIDYLKTFRSVGAVSKRLQNLFKESGLEKIYYTPNGVDINEFQPDYLIYDKSPLKCAFAGRDVDLKKGHLTYILPAINKVNNVERHFAVSNFRRNTVSPFSDNSCCLSHNQMPDFFKKAHVYICMSREEGSCRPILESMAAGCAVISSDCGAIHELNSNLVVERDIDKIAEKIDYYNKNRSNLLYEMKSNRKIAEKFSWERVSKYWYNWIEENL